MEKQVIQPRGFKRTTWSEALALLGSEAETLTTPPLPPLCMLLADRPHCAGSEHRLWCEQLHLLQGQVLSLQVPMPAGQSLT